MRASQHLKLTLTLAILLIGGNGIVAQRRSRVSNAQPSPSTSPSPLPTPVPATRHRITVKLKNGDPVSGNFIGSDSNAIQVEVAGNRLNIKIDDIATINFIDASKSSVSEPPKAENPSSPTSSSASDTNSKFVGTWTLQFTAQGGQSMPGTLTIYEDSGTLNSTLAISGQISTPSKFIPEGNNFNVSFTSIEQGQPVGFTLSGNVDKDQISGSMNTKLPNAPTILFTGSRASTATSGAGSSSVGSGQLAIQVGIVYKMGGAQAVARTQFHLLNENLVKILQDAGLQPDRNMDLATTFAFATRFQSQSKYASFYQAAMRAIQPHIIRTVTTDFGGLAQFDPVPPGVYYVMGYTETRRGFAVWNVQVNIPAGQYSLVLDQNNAAIAL
jgi:hypothetical protein